MSATRICRSTANQTLLPFAAADSIGYIIGAYRYGESPADLGKFTLTLRLGTDGRWLIFSDMDNGSR